MHIPNEIQIALDILNNNGYEAYIVGGAIRNHLLNLPIDDYDITTNATPSIIKVLFNKYPIFDYGLKHGTVTISINHILIEITTYRLETDYIDHRHPNKIAFTNDLKQDLKRRDFTINAICYNTKYIDYFHGINDIHNKIIRCINDPFKRFDEDALRILRAIRFKAQLGFNIDDETNNAIFTLKHLLNYISIERKVTEFNKIIKTDNLANTINQYLPIFNTFINIDEVDNKINQLPPILELRLAYLLKDNDYIAILDSLKYSKQIKNTVTSIIININNSFKLDDLILLKQKYPQQLPLILKYQEIINHLDINDINNKLNNITVYLPKHLAITPNEIKDFIPNNLIGQTLNKLIYLINHQVITNNHDEIIEYLKNQ